MLSPGNYLRIKNDIFMLIPNGLKPFQLHVTIELLSPVFAQFGIPETIVSDNGSCFVSKDF